MPEASTVDIDYAIAEHEHVDQLFDLFNTFFEESQLPELGLEVDPEKARRWLARAIEVHRPEHVLAFDRETDLLVGALGYCVDDTAFVQPYAFLDKFYVRRGWRIKQIGSTLLRLAEDFAKSEGCIAFRAGLSSGIGTGKQLFIENGYSEIAGSTLLAKRL
jgi:GNAT superfamily N-acetyltransferase